MVWQGWADAKVAVRRGHVHLIAGAPGGYKSVIATNLAIKQRVSCLYLGMDSDANTWSARALQLLAHMPDGDAAERAVQNGEQWALDYLAQAPWVRLMFPESPTVDEIVLRVFAFAEATGDFPEFIVIDNLVDVIHDNAKEAEGEAHVMEELTRLARQSKAAVLVLTHVTGEHEDGHSPIPLSGLRNKVGKKPSWVMTMHSSIDDRQLFMKIVKNRNGPRGVAIELRVYPEMCVVVDK